MNNTYLAIDFGGGSGRVIAGQITGGQLHLDEIYRSPTDRSRWGTISIGTFCPYSKK